MLAWLGIDSCSSSPASFFGQSFNSPVSRRRGLRYLRYSRVFLLPMKCLNMVILAAGCALFDCPIRDDDNFACQSQCDGLSASQAHTFEVIPCSVCRMWFRSFSVFIPILAFKIGQTLVDMIDRWIILRLDYRNKEIRQMHSMAQSTVVSYLFFLCPSRSGTRFNGEVGRLGMCVVA